MYFHYASPTYPLNTIALSIKKKNLLSCGLQQYEQTFLAHVTYTEVVLHPVKATAKVGQAQTDREAP